MRGTSFPCTDYIPGMDTVTPLLYESLEATRYPLAVLERPKVCGDLKTELFQEMDPYLRHAELSACN